MPIRPVIVRLTPAMIALARDVGRETDEFSRSVKAVRRSGQPDHATPADNFLGALGEIAVAKQCGIPYVRHIGDYKAKDVGMLQVRSIRRAHHRLVIQFRDLPDDPFILVYCQADEGVAAIQGWAFGREAMYRRFIASYRDGGDAYFLPRARLRQYDVTEFRKGIYRPRRRRAA